MILILILMFILALLLMGLGLYLGIEIAKAKADHKFISIGGILSIPLCVLLIYTLDQLYGAYLSVRLTNDARHPSAIYRFGKNLFTTGADTTETDTGTTCCFKEKK